MADQTVIVSFKGETYHLPARADSRETVGDFCSRLQQVVGTDFASETVKLLQRGKHLGGFSAPVLLEKDRDVPAVSAGKLQPPGGCHGSRKP